MQVPFINSIIKKIWDALTGYDIYLSGVKWLDSLWNFEFG
jgi:hypothetical protein